jgi:hypothetical protein
MTRLWACYLNWSIAWPVRQNIPNFYHQPLDRSSTEGIIGRDFWVLMPSMEGYSAGYPATTEEGLS